MTDATDPVQWCALPTAKLNAFAPAWSVVDFFAQAPQHLQGSLLLAMTRAQALLVAFTDGRRMLLIHFRDAAAVWQYQSQERCEAVQRIRDDNAWLMAFMPAGTGNSTMPLPAAPITLGAPARGHVDVLVGAHLRITRLPASRSWDWAWGQTLGPAFLSVFVDRSAVEIRQWLSENLPYGYAFDGDRVRATRNLQPEGRLRHTDEIWTADGEIHFVHGYYRHVEPVDNARAVFLLRKLARAELGELSFDVFDGDYGSLCASGYGCASLSKYLDHKPRYDRRKPHPWNRLRRLVITVPAASDVSEHVRVALNRELGLPPDAPFGAALARPIQDLPRWITVRLPAGTSSFDRSRHDPGNRAFKRLDWSIQFHGESTPADD